MLFVIARRGTSDQFEAGSVKNAWFYCVNCRKGCVSNGLVVVPGKLGFPTPEGTPEQEAQLWEEVRRCLSAGAFNAAAMLCRKLLLHMVFTHKRSLDRNATPDDLSFAAAVRYLADNGVITEAMNNLATNIKDVGNKANHELPHVTEQMPETSPCSLTIYSSASMRCPNAHDTKQRLLAMLLSHTTATLEPTPKTRKPSAGAE